MDNNDRLMKYIDAEKLKAKIEEMKQSNTVRDDEDYAQYELDVACGYEMACEEILNSITYLQREQLVKSELKEEKIECSPVMKELIGKLFEVGHAYNFGFGPKDFLQEQPEMDLDEEIDRMWSPRFNLGWDDNSLLSINHKSFEVIARHFYELGLNARKEENK